MASGSNGGGGGGGGGYIHGGGHQREEAERWLSIAQKLLIARDLHGAKTFAIRARESDTTFELVHQIVAVIDTLLAAESGVATASHPFDWYSILQLQRLCPSIDVAAAQYRKLATLLTPDRNQFPFADHAFRLVCEAWSVLSNPMKRAFYDGELQLSQLGQHNQQLNQLGQQQQQPTVYQQQQHQPHRVIPTVAVPAQPTSPPPAPLRPVPSPLAPQQATAAAPTPSPATPVRPTPIDNGKEVEPNEVNPAPRSPPTESTQEPSFWTACPYCYMFYEYPEVYEDCTLRCQKCKRAFTAVPLPPPPMTAGNDNANFCCWGFFPLGFSGNPRDLSSSNWAPFTPMFACPGGNGEKPSKKGPRFYYANDDDYAEGEGEDPGDDDDWRNDETRKRKAKKVREHRNVVTDPAILNRPIVLALGNKETNKKGLVGNSGRKQMAKGMKDLGKLDLNVEFSNDADEPTRVRVNQGHGNGGEEDIIGGSGFFEGLDEFLNSLPILNPVGDDKVKAA